MRVVVALVVALVGLAVTPPAMAAHCHHHQLYRVSLGRCVAKTSVLAKGLARRFRTVAARPVSSEHENFYVEILIPAGRGPGRGATPGVTGVTATPR